MNKWDYIEKIKKIPSKNTKIDKYDNHLERMLNNFGKINLQEITLDEAKYYYGKLVGNKGE